MKKKMAQVFQVAVFATISFLGAGAAPDEIHGENKSAALIQSAQAALIQSAQEEIRISQGDAHAETACDIYLEQVLNGAGIPFPHFLANDFDKAMARYLPNWKMTEFVYDEAGHGRALLRQFLNDRPDQSALLMQWPRTGESGHVALVVKEKIDVYTIYQAQQGLKPPFRKAVKLEGLLYPKNEWGERSRLRVFSDPIP